MSTSLPLHLLWKSSWSGPLHGGSCPFPTLGMHPSSHPGCQGVFPPQPMKSVWQHLPKRCNPGCHLPLQPQGAGPFRAVSQYPLQGTQEQQGCGNALLSKPQQGSWQELSLHHLPEHKGALGEGCERVGLWLKHRNVRLATLNLTTVMGGQLLQAIGVHELLQQAGVAGPHCRTW